MPNLTAIFPLPPAEAVAYMQARGLLSPTFSCQDIYAEEHAHQFTVAKLSRLDLLDAIYRECVKNAAEGQSLREFAKQLRPLLEKEGWWGKREVIDPKTGEVGTTTFDPARLKLIYDVNLRTAHSAGTWERIVRNQATHPYIRYVTQRDERVRDSHRAWDNLTLPVGHAFWLTHTPPNGWRCRCRITSMTQAEYDKGLAPNGKAIKTDAPETVMVDWKDRQGNIRQIPAGIDPGWDYNPGIAAARARNLAQITQDKLAAASPAIREAAIRAGLGDNGGMKTLMDFTGQRPGLFDLPAVPVTELTGKEFGDGLSRRELARAADAKLHELQRGKGLANDDTGWVLRINKSGRKKMGDNADQSAAESKAVAAIEALARNAVLAENHADIEHNNEFVRAVSRLYVPLVIDGVPYRVKLTVKDYVGVNAKKELHALAAIEIENAPLGISPTSGDESTVQSGQPTTGRTLSIADLLAGATLFNDLPFRR